MDHTAPSFIGDIVLEETEIPLEKERSFANFFDLFDMATNHQVKLTVSVSDAMSGINQVVATTTDGKVYPCLLYTS